MWGGSIQKCAKAADLLPATRRRLLGDLRRLEEEPLPLAAARPCSDDDLTLWHGVIGVQMQVTHLDLVTVPLHFLIDFPADYPQSAPNIGFSFEFAYRGGAAYTMQDGRLKGKKVICLDVLGNFAGVHTEWKSNVGSGWSPAYTVTTLLVQLQSVLGDLGTQMSQRERDTTYQSATRFCEQNPAAVLELLDEDDIRDRREKRRSDAQFSRLTAGDDALAARLRGFADRAGLSADAARHAEFLELLSMVATAARGGATACADTGGQCGGAAAAATQPALASKPVPVVDTNICCFATGKLYTEALLGVGVSREHKNLATAGELLSKEAFDGSLRVNTNKSPFEFFLPVWINTAHAAGNAAWCKALEDSVLLVGRQVFETKDLDSSALQVFPRLINQMIVEVMKPEASKSAAIATFEALCNFWRTLRHLVETRKTLRDQIGAQLDKFTRNEAFRHKDVSQDLGMVLVLYTVFQGFPGCPSREAFITAYADENSLRWVMWWQRAGTPAESTPVFEQTKVSREILMFQLMVVDVVLGGEKVAETLQSMEATNCKLPERLELLQAQWRERKAGTDGWGTYFRNIGAPRPNFPNTGAWIADCARRAAEKGPKYGGPKGSGKGSAGGGKGGKGGERGGQGGYNRTYGR